MIDQVSVLLTDVPIQRRESRNTNAKERERERERGGAFKSLSLTRVIRTVAVFPSTPAKVSDRAVSPSVPVSGGNNLDG